ncbi:MAG: hypothetical protein U9R38_05475, partial [Candidatus Margulisiibacteriota bacterium]|nr:hypothetical protein [Candidatus Margulisiibacteriota bacterium]
MSATASDEVKVTAVGFGNRSGWLSWGTNYKAVAWNTTGTEETGWSGDIGFLVRITPELNFGILAQDLLTSKDFISAASGRVGPAFRPLDGRLTIAGDLELDRSSMSYGHFGVETQIVRGLTLRGGYDRGEPTLGVSLYFAALSFDYAALISEGAGNTQRFEVGIKVLPLKDSNIFFACSVLK